MRLNQRVVLLIILVGCIPVLIGCQSQKSASQDDEFRRLSQDIAWDQGLELRVPRFVAPGQASDDKISLEVYNNSAEDIQFPLGMGRKIYMYSPGAGWIEVSDRGRYIGSPLLLSSRKGKDLRSLEGITDAVFHPDLSGLGDVKQLRFVIVGVVVRDGRPTDQQVGAYVDVNLDDYPPPQVPSPGEGQG